MRRPGSSGGGGVPPERAAESLARAVMGRATLRLRSRASPPARAMARTTPPAVASVDFHSTLLTAATGTPVAIVHPLTADRLCAEYKRSPSRPVVRYAASVLSRLRSRRSGAADLPTHRALSRVRAMMCPSWSRSVMVASAATGAGVENCEVLRVQRRRPGEDLEHPHASEQLPVEGDGHALDTLAESQVLRRLPRLPQNARDERGKHHERKEGGRGEDEKIRADLHGTRMEAATQAGIEPAPVGSAKAGSRWPLAMLEGMRGGDPAGPAPYPASSVPNRQHHCWARISPLSGLFQWPATVPR